MRHFCLLFCLLVIVVNLHVACLVTASTCTNSSGCGVRTYLADLQEEYSKLNCISNKLNSSITIMTATNSSLLSSVILNRKKQLQKVEDAKKLLALEIDPLNDKCTRMDGDNCDLSCFGVAPSKSTACSGHGACTSLDTCSCYPGWTGANCSMTMCNNILSTNSTVCNGRGTCISNQTCVCNAGIYGPFCEYYNISGDDTSGRRMVNGVSKATCLEYYQANPYADSGLYWIKPQTTDTLVYCNMTMGGGGIIGGFTFVRRISITNTWWPADDNFVGNGYGTYNPRSISASNAVFGLDFKAIPRTHILFTTGDYVHWILVSLDQLTSGFGGNTCTTPITLSASSLSPNAPTTVNICRRGTQIYPEDPWLSTQNQGYISECETHSMLWGEASHTYWQYWKNNHGGINVFIR